VFLEHVLLSWYPCQRGPTSLSTTLVTCYASRDTCYAISARWSRQGLGFARRGFDRRQNAHVHCHRALPRLSHHKLTDLHQKTGRLISSLLVLKRPDHALEGTRQDRPLPPGLVGARRARPARACTHKPPLFPAKPFSVYKSFTLQKCILQKFVGKVNRHRALPGSSPPSVKLDSP